MSGDGDILAAIGRLDSRLAGLELKLDSSVQKLEAGQDRLEATVTRLRVDVMQRIDRLQEKVTQLSDESVVNYASSSTIDKRLRRYEDQHRDVTCSE